MNRNTLLGLLSLSSLLACGGSPPPETPKATAPETQSTETDTVAAAQPDEDIPSRCVVRKNACMPPIHWAERVCGDVYPDLALYMFQRDTPWTRFYMKMGLNAVNGWGPTVAEELVQREEVLVINHRLTRDALEVEGSLGTYDVLRWNGSCVTLDVSEVTKSAPSDPKNSRISFRSLSDPMQDALRRSDEVAETVRARGKECKGATIGRVTKRCEELDRELGDVVARYVRDTSDLPVPEFLP
jgi:hypothetical protein